MLPLLTICRTLGNLLNFCGLSCLSVKWHLINLERLSKYAGKHRCLAHSRRLKDSYSWVLFSKHHVRHSESFKDHPLISIPTSFYRIFEKAYKNTLIIIKIWWVKIGYQEGETLLECPGLCLPRWMHMVWHSTSSYTPSNPKFMPPARPVSFVVPTQAILNSHELLSFSPSCSTHSFPISRKTPAIQLHRPKT